MSELKLGKKAAKLDKRTFAFRMILKDRFPSPPPFYDVDSQFHFPVTNPMFANDQWGDCVIASRAHQTRRFEGYEQNLCLPITDSMVLKEYWKEGGANCIRKKPDNGLVMLDSLNKWRKDGWKISTKSYHCYAFAAVHPADTYECMTAIYLLNGLNIGLSLPISAQNQDVWDVATGPGSVKGSWGGHCVYIKSYDHNTLTCVTWGGLKKMTWGFFWMYCIMADMKILTSDLNWVEAGNLRQGDKIIGFEEEAKKGGMRHYQEAMIEGVERIQRPCYELTFDDGTVIRCSAEHRWLTNHHGGSRWLTTSHLRCSPKLGSNVVKPLETWERDNTREGGYLAAAFDGEGCLTQKCLTNKDKGVADVRLDFAQKDNAMLATVRELLSQKGYHFTECSKATTKQINISGRKNTLKFLGSMRPPRLLAKFNPELLGWMGLKTVKLTGMKNIGEQEVVALKTTSKTFFVEGLASHNCDEAYAIVDGKNIFTPNSPVDIEKLNGYLQAVS